MISSKKLKANDKEWPCIEMAEFDERVSHFNEIDHLKKIARQIEECAESIKKRDLNCKVLMNNLLSSAGRLTKCCQHILKRHWEHCLDEDDWQGSDEERQDEIDRASRFFARLGFDSKDIKIRVPEKMENELYQVMTP